jgi:hypothetical protein
MGSVKGMPPRNHITKIMNNLTAQFNLFRKQWISGNTSLNYIEKTTLSREEKMLIKKTFKKDEVMLGVTKLAKELGVTEPVLREYINTLI